MTKIIFSLLLSFSLMHGSTAVIAGTNYYNGHDLQIACAGFESGFTMGDFRRFKCEAYLMGYLDHMNYAAEKAQAQAIACLTAKTDIAGMAQLVMQYIKSDSMILEKSGAEIIQHVLDENQLCE